MEERETGKKETGGGGRRVCGGRWEVVERIKGVGGRRVYIEEEVVEEEVEVEETGMKETGGGGGRVCGGRWEVVERIKDVGGRSV